MNEESVFDGISRRAPLIVSLTLIASLVTDWLDAPAAFPRTVALLVGGLALMLFAAPGRKQTAAPLEEDGEVPKSWIAYELAGKGTPPGFYALGFFVIVTIVLTGIQSAYSLPAWAALCLGLAWGRANASYGSDDQ